MTKKHPLLNELRDVPGVFGSFVVSPDGALRAWDVPATLHEDILREVAPRILRMRETFEHEGDELTNLSMRFGRQLLFVRTTQAGALCVLAGADVSVPALRMAASLVCRRVEALPAPSASDSRAPEPPEDPGATARRRYRGAFFG